MEEDLYTDMSKFNTVVVPLMPIQHSVIIQTPADRLRVYSTLLAMSASSFSDAQFKQLVALLQPISEYCANATADQRLKLTFDAMKRFNGMEFLLRHGHYRWENEWSAGLDQIKHDITTKGKTLEAYNDAIRKLKDISHKYYLRENRVCFVFERVVVRRMMMSAYSGSLKEHIEQKWQEVSADLDSQERDDRNNRIRTAESPDLETLYQIIQCVEHNDVIDPYFLEYTDPSLE